MVKKYSSFEELYESTVEMKNKIKELTAEEIAEDEGWMNYDSGVPSEDITE